MIYITPYPFFFILDDSITHCVVECSMKCVEGTFHQWKNWIMINENSHLPRNVMRVLVCLNSMTSGVIKLLWAHYTLYPS